MPIIQRPTIGRKLMRSLGLTAQPDSILSPEIVPVIVVENLAHTHDNEFVRPSAVHFAQPAAGGATQSIVGLSKVTDDVDVTVTRISWVISTGQIFIVRSRATVASLGSISGSFTDFNTRGRPQTLAIRNALVGGIPSLDVLYDIRSLNNTAVFLDVNIKLGKLSDANGSHQIFLQMLSANLPLEVNFDFVETEPLA